MYHSLQWQAISDGLRHIKTTDLVPYYARHGEKCYPFTIKKSPNVGRYMVAVRDIKQMELILSEMPVVVGPYTKTESLHCVACFKKIKGND